MSELKHQLMLNKEMSWVPCYLKPEVDEVIAEKDKEIAELKAAADFAKWRDCVDGRPGDAYFKAHYDWVLVKAREKFTGYNIELPYIAEYGRISGRWHFRDTQDDHPYFRDLEVLAWRPIEKLGK